MNLQHLPVGWQMWTISDQTNARERWTKVPEPWALSAGRQRQDCAIQF